MLGVDSNRSKHPGRLNVLEMCSILHSCFVCDILVTLVTVEIYNNCKLIVFYSGHGAIIIIVF